MNCKQVQSRLLEEVDPNRPAPELQSHVDQCPECQEWQRRVLLIEQHVPLLRVPASTAMAGLIDKVMTAPAPVEATSNHVVSINTWTTTAARNKQRWTPRNKRVAWGVAAASIAIVAFGAWMLQGPKHPTDSTQIALDPLISQLLEANQKLALARNHGESFEYLADISNTLQLQARDLAKDVAVDNSVTGREVLIDLAERYRMSIQGTHQLKGVVQVATELSPEDRQRYLGGVMDKLSVTASEVEALAAQHPDVAEPLKTIAKSARQAEEKMRAVAQRDVKLNGVTAKQDTPSKEVTP